MNAKKVTAMTVEEIQAATAALTKVQDEMEFILPLNPAERLTAGRMGPKAVQMAQMRLAAARQHKDELPPVFDLRKFEREVELFTALDECLNAVRALQQDVRDTFLTIGRSAVESGKVAFAHLQAGAVASDGLKRSVHLAKARSRKSKAGKPEIAVANMDAPAPAPAPAALPITGAAAAPAKVESKPEPSDQAA